MGEIERKLKFKCQLRVKLKNLKTKNHIAKRHVSPGTKINLRGQFERN